MSDNRGPDWLDDATAERLLRGTADPSMDSSMDTSVDEAQHVATDPADDKRAAALAGLLAAAAAPAVLDPAREEAAVAAFRAARDAGVLTVGVRQRHRRRSDDWRPGARGLRHAARSAKTVTGALFATLTLGGVAVAAAVGALPTSFGSGAHGPDPLQSGGSSARSGSTDPGRSASPAPDQERPAGGASRGVATPTPAASPGSTDYKALCTAYAAADWRRGGMDRQSYRQLEKAAGGGRHRVRQYCAGLLGPGGRADDSGDGVGSPTDPTGTPSGDPGAGGSSIQGDSGTGSGDAGVAGSGNGGGNGSDDQSPQDAN
jgi:hypothetical protein